MFRKLGVAVLFVCLAAWLAGCGGNDEGASNERTTTARASQPTPEEKSREAIPEAPEPLDVMEGIEINPYFDEAGELSEMAVSPGKFFTFYVFVQYEEPFYISAAEYRLELPKGVSIVGETKFKEDALSVGDPLNDYSIAFGCIEPGKYYLVRYKCMADEQFTGGEIKVTPALTKQGNLFLGFACCQPDIVKLPAKGGTAVLTKQ
jgi:hypothetical protein